MSNQVFASGGVGGGILTGGATAVVLPQAGVLPATGTGSLLLNVTIALAVAVITSMVISRISKRTV